MAIPRLTSITPVIDHAKAELLALFRNFNPTTLIRPQTPQKDSYDSARPSLPYIANLLNTGSRQPRLAISSSAPIKVGGRVTTAREALDQAGEFGDHLLARAIGVVTSSRENAQLLGVG